MFSGIFSLGIVIVMLLSFPCYLFADGESKEHIVASNDGEATILASNDGEEMTLARNDGEEMMLTMYYGKDATVITPTRYLKPVSQVAENISVVTSDMIRVMNAHTVAEALNGVTGVQMDLRQTFGNLSDISLQGSDPRHVRVMIDGVTLNLLESGFSQIGDMPVQNIEKIEVIKGPASSSWGSSLGGVINIITKSGYPTTKVGGTLMTSYGERNSGDYRADAGGKISNFEYYIYGGHLGTNGFYPKSAFSDNSFYTKEKLDLTDKINVTYTLGYNKSEKGEGAYPSLDFFGDSWYHDLFTTLTLNGSFIDQLTFSLGGRYNNQLVSYKYYTLASSTLISEGTAKDNSKGATATLTWTPENHTVILGGEYDDGELNASALNGVKSLRKAALFANDTMSLIKNVYITPGLRFDQVNTGGSFYSPSLGVAYNPVEDFTFRATAAKGFNVPPLGEVYATGLFYVPNPGLKVEKVTSYQAGIETTLLKYAWLKLSFFRHEVADGLAHIRISDQPLLNTYVNHDKLRRQGLEVEMETFPVYNLSLNAGYALMDGEDMLTHTRLYESIRHTIDAGLRYNKNSLMAYLYCHYLVWDNIPSVVSYADRAFVFNLNVIKKFYENKRLSAEAFLTGHNIFNASQYFANPNARRWVEGGVRFNF
ncbi:MAG: TonB-dependent receptor [Nitrospirae bacterium]|nr:TonB-dependent receptor [Nitrospirota bacterium]